MADFFFKKSCMARLVSVNCCFKSWKPIVRMMPGKYLVYLSNGDVPFFRVSFLAYFF